MANEGYSAPFALQEILVQKRAVQHQKLLDSLNLAQAESQIEDRLERQKNAEEVRNNTENERDYRRAQNLAQFMPEGDVTEEAAAGLEKHGFGGFVKRTPGRSLEIPSVTEGLPEGLGGAPATQGTFRMAQIPGGITTPGGTNVQAAKAAVAAKLEQQKRDLVAKADAADAAAIRTTAENTAKREAKAADDKRDDATRRFNAALMAASRRDSGTQKPTYVGTAAEGPHKGKAVYASEGKQFIPVENEGRVGYYGVMGAKPSTVNEAGGPSSAEFNRLSTLTGDAAPKSGMLGDIPASAKAQAAHKQQVAQIVARYKASPEVKEAVIAAMANLERKPDLTVEQIIAKQKEAGAPEADLIKFAEILRIVARK